MLVLGPLLVANPSIHVIWIKNATNLAVLGASWVVADSLAQPTSAATLKRESQNA